MPTFWDNLSVSSSSPSLLGLLTLESGTDNLFRNVGAKYHSTKRNVSEERRFQALTLEQYEHKAD